MATHFVHEWKPEGPPRAGLLIAHGYAEHGGRYGALAAALNGAGVYVRSYDQRGHGRSGGRRGQLLKRSTAGGDLASQLEAARGRRARCRGFCWGIVWAGWWRRIFWLCRLAGGRPDPVEPVSGAAGRCAEVEAAFRGAGACVAVAAGGAAGTSALSRDPAAVMAYEGDPLVYHGPVRAGAGLVLLEGAADCRAWAAGWRAAVVAAWDGGPDSLSSAGAMVSLRGWLRGGGRISGRRATMSCFMMCAGTDGGRGGGVGGGAVGVVRAGGLGGGGIPLVWGGRAGYGGGVAPGTRRRLGRHRVARAWWGLGGLGWGAVL